MLVGVFCRGFEYSNAISGFEYSHNFLTCSIVMYQFKGELKLKTKGRKNDMTSNPACLLSNSRWSIF